MPVLIAMYIFLVSHLSVDVDFSEGTKTMSWVVFVIIGILYVVFGLVL